MKPLSGRIPRPRQPRAAFTTGYGTSRGVFHTLSANMAVVHIKRLRMGGRQRRFIGCDGCRVREGGVYMRGFRNF